MSVYTNAADGSQESADAYIAAVLELVADRDPLELLEELPTAARELTANLNDTQLRAPEAPGKWSIIEVAQHLADSEMMWGCRLRLVLGEDRPTLTGYDQDAWVDRMRYRNASINEALDLFAANRAANLRLLRSLDVEQWKRAGVHSERGDESVEHMVRLYAGHGVVHRRQLERLRAAVTGPG